MSIQYHRFHKVYAMYAEYAHLIDNTPNVKRRASKWHELWYTNSLTNPEENSLSQLTSRVRKIHHMAYNVTWHVTHSDTCCTVCLGKFNIFIQETHSKSSQTLNSYILMVLTCTRFIVLRIWGVPNKNNNVFSSFLFLSCCFNLETFEWVKDFAKIIRKRKKWKVYII